MSWIALEYKCHCDYSQTCEWEKKEKENTHKITVEVNRHDKKVLILNINEIDFTKKFISFQLTENSQDFYTNLDSIIETYRK